MSAPAPGPSTPSRLADSRVEAVPSRVAAAGARPSAPGSTDPGAPVRSADPPPPQPMPWCETCSRFLNPNSLDPDGSCPECGRVVAEPRNAEAEAEVPKAPWHFKLLLVAVVVYLTWRVIQMIGWVV